MQIAYHTVSAVLKNQGVRIAIFPYFNGPKDQAIKVCKDQLKLHNMAHAYEDFEVRAYTIDDVEVVEEFQAAA